MIEAIVVGLLLVTFAGFYATESLMKGKVRVRGRGPDSFWYHWVEQEEAPKTYWFWTTFYTFAAFFGVYVLLMPA